MKKHASCAAALTIAVLLAASSPAGLRAPLHAQEPDSRPAQPVSTKWMVSELQRIISAADPMQNPFRNTERYERILAHEKTEAERARRLNLSLNRGFEQLLAGDTAPAIEILEENLRVLSGPNVTGADRHVVALHRMLGVAYLRLGEEQNCLERHSSDSCLFPIRGDGIHTVPAGSRGALEHYRVLLGRYPDDLAYRWLVNLAHMTLGEYPDGVPETWRIPAETFASSHDVGRFRDVAASCGLAAVGLAGGVVLEDLDGDGLLDVMVSSWGLEDQLRLFRNQGDGTFVERTAEAGLIGLVGGLNLCHADYDNDGDADVLVLRGAWLFTEGHYPNSLLRNDGHGRFTDVTRESGLLSYHPTQTAAWGDYDNDGWLDLFIGNESTPKDPHPSQLFRNRGDGTFEDLAASLGVADSGFVKGAVWGDYDNDGRLDLFLSRYMSPNILYRNAGPSPDSDDSPSQRPFENVSSPAGIGGPNASFPTWFWDYDNDGWLDITVCTFGSFQGSSLEPIVADYLGLPHDDEGIWLYHNNGDGTFTERSRALGLRRSVMAMSANFGDLDSDGFLDCYLGTGQPDLASLVPNRMFRNAGGQRFQEVTTSGGFGHLQKGHGIAFADIDHDGDQDVFAVMGGAYTGDVYPNVLFENPGHGAHWVELHLHGVRSNRSAIGARIAVTVQLESGTRTLHRTVGTGGSFGSAPLRQHIGLGAARSIRDVSIHWPTTGQTQRLTGLAFDTAYRVREGDPGPEPIPRHPFRLGGATSPHRGHAPADDGD